ncbi:MAG: hypothetical protein GWN00_26575, partial [Aliifodinibius sp.]|nr:hypothetical protein [Fodinibius sp.]NIV14406.1 hypothetical protein [Fodinibius sp.]NIY28238.1 hypothetical protein [Fodinibius sp.]
MNNFFNGWKKGFGLFLILSFCIAVSFPTSGFSQANSERAQTIVSSAIPSNSNPLPGEQITVAINIDMTAMPAPDDNLGSFTATLQWDPNVLSFISHGGILQGFVGVVNTTQAGSGMITFNGANPLGVSGNFDVLQITFQALSSDALNKFSGDNIVGSTVLDLEYSAMAAAFTFTNLLPFLTVNDGFVQVGGQPEVISSAIPSNTTPNQGDQITVAINFDMTGMAGSPDTLLGSFTGTINWDPSVLSFVSHGGILQGFVGVVNTTQAGSGMITFNGANPLGVSGIFDVLVITFDAVGGGTTALDLEYSAMAAALTFTDLLPFLT